MTAGSYLGIVAVLIVLVGMFMPTYIFSVEDDDGENVDLVTFYSYKSPVFQVEKLEEMIDEEIDETTEQYTRGRGSDDVFRSSGQGTYPDDDEIDDDIDESVEESTEDFMAPFEMMGQACMVGFMMILLFLVITLIRILLTKESKKRAKIMIKAGASFFIILIVALIIVMVVLPSVLPIDDMVGNEDGDEDDFGADFILEILGHPVKGSYEVSEIDWTMSWGFAIGLWVIIIGYSMLIVGGVVEMVVGKKKYPSYA